MLTAVWLIPVVGGIVVAALPHRFGKWLGVLVALAVLVLTGYLAYTFDPGAHGYQFVEKVQWIPGLHVDYHLGVDGISLWLLVLNALIGLVAVLATPVEMRNSSRFIALLLVMQGGMAGVFLAVDLLVFYVFFEAMLIPAYFLLWMWGEGPRPLQAAIKFVLFTLVGSLLMLVGIIGEYVFSGATSFDLTTLAQHQPSSEIQFGLFFLFAAAFAVKTPLFPFHSWLPDAYLAAPTPMLLAFAGVMGKTGAYAMLRILVPLFHSPVWWWDWDQVMPVLAVAGIIWGSLLALAQTDMKGVVAYSSIAHMAFIVLGIFSLNVQGQQGAVVQMINHGVVVAALFLLVAWIERRAGGRDLRVVRALGARMPVMAGVFVVVTMAALGLPGLNSFVGEFMILLGAWKYSAVLTVVACIGLVLTPVYMLRLFQGSMQGTPDASDREPLVDLRGRELALMAPFVILMFVLGLYPYILTRVMTVSALGLGLPWS